MLSSEYVRDVVQRAEAEATRYPLPRRIAAWLHLNDRDEAWFHAQFSNIASRHPVYNAIQNELRNINNGLIDITPELARLARGCCDLQES